MSVCVGVDVVMIRTGVGMQLPVVACKTPMDAGRTFGFLVIMTIIIIIADDLASKFASARQCLSNRCRFQSMACPIVQHLVGIGIDLGPFQFIRLVSIRGVKIFVILFFFFIFIFVFVIILFFFAGILRRELMGLGLDITKRSRVTGPLD